MRVQEKVDPADSRLESGAQAVCNAVWGAGAGMKKSYPVLLTPSCGGMGSTEVLDLLRQLQDVPHSNGQV
jgi:hypothetical protein